MLGFNLERKSTSKQEQVSIPLNPNLAPFQQKVKQMGHRPNSLKNEEGPEDGIKTQNQRVSGTTTRGSDLYPGLSHVPFNVLTPSLLTSFPPRSSPRCLLSKPLPCCSLMSRSLSWAYQADELGFADTHSIYCEEWDSLARKAPGHALRTGAHSDTPEQWAARSHQYRDDAHLPSLSPIPEKVKLFIVTTLITFVCIS